MSVYHAVNEVCCVQEQQLPMLDELTYQLFVGLPASGVQCSTAEHVRMLLSAYCYHGVSADQ